MDGRGGVGLRPRSPASSGFPGALRAMPEGSRRESLAAELLLCLGPAPSGPGHALFAPARGEAHRRRPIWPTAGLPLFPDPSGAVAACAAGFPAGIDAERCGRVSEAVIARFFAPEERAFLGGCLGRCAQTPRPAVDGPGELGYSAPASPCFDPGRKLPPSAQGLAFDFCAPRPGYVLCVCRRRRRPGRPGNTCRRRRWPTRFLGLV
jgi:hypothetical protein